MLDEFSDCSQVDLLLDPFLDNELSKEQNQGVSLHLSDCKQCQVRLRETKLLLSRLGSLSRLPLPQPLKSNWDALIAENHSRKKSVNVFAWSSNGILSPVALALSIVFVVFAFSLCSHLSPAIVATKVQTRGYALPPQEHAGGAYTQAGSSTNAGEELLAVYPAETSSFSEEVGLSTDEDGLYALKL